MYKNAIRHREFRLNHPKQPFAFFARKCVSPPAIPYESQVAAKPLALRGTELVAAKLVVVSDGWELVPRGANQPSQGELSNEEQVIDLDGRCVLRTQHGSRRRARARCRSGFENRVGFRSRRRRRHESRCAWRPYRRHEPGVHGPRFGGERSDVAEQQVESRRPITGTVPPRLNRTKTRAIRRKTRAARAGTAASRSPRTKATRPSHSRIHNATRARRHSRVSAVARKPISAQMSRRRVKARQAAPGVPALPVRHQLKLRPGARALPTSRSTPSRRPRFARP
jgi:hypothetical protein